MKKSRICNDEGKVFWKKVRKREKEERMREEKWCLNDKIVPKIKMEILGVKYEEKVSPCNSFYIV